MAPRHSAAVYRRRRLVFLLGLLLVIAIIVAGVWALVVRPWESEASATPGPTETTQSAPPTQSAAPTADGTPTPAETPGVVACQAADIEVTAVTDAETYAEGVLPKLSISLTNNGTTDCTINVGTTTQQFVISSGNDVWWRSTDCQENPSDMIVTLTAGQTVPSSAPITWDRTRSSVDTCADENRPRAPGGGASYHVAVSIGGFDSRGTRQFILN
jgi:hypothetical protein